MEQARIAVLIPCYNEALTIAQVVRQYHAALPDAVIYVYDNNSTDGTAAIAAAEGPWVTVRRERRQGKGNVIRAMFRDVDADCYLMTDGDDTYPADAAPEMARLVLEEGADMVIGDRLSSTYFTENKRPFHNTGNRLVRGLINMLFHSRVNDIMTGSRAFSRLFVKNFPVLSQGFEIETEMTIHALDKNFAVREMPVPYRDRPEGSVSKLNTFSDGARVLRTVGTLFRDYRPLLFFGWISAALLVIALAFFIPIFADFLRTGVVAKYPTLIVVGAIATIAFVLWVCGMILEVINKKFRQMYELELNRRK